MKEDKKVFLEVDCVEPVYNISPFSCSGAPYLKGIKVWIGSDGHLFQCDQYTVCEPEIARDDGRRQVVALAKELGEMKFADRNELFGNYTVPDILNHRSYEKIVEMLKDWKEEQKIHIKDEVVHENTSTVKFAVTEIHDTYMSGVAKDGKVYQDCTITEYKKTGLHVDDLDAYLEV